MVKNILCFFCFCLALIGPRSQNNVYAGDYHPPFELSGIVVSVEDANIEVHMPYINKNVTVSVSEDTFISNRLKDKTNPCSLSEITAEDLVVIKGIVKQEAFVSTEISFLPN